MSKVMGWIMGKGGTRSVCGLAAVLLLAGAGNTATITPADLLWVEEGERASYTIALSAQPAGNVTVTAAVTSETASVLFVLGNPLTFTPSNWNTEQTVTVTGLNDDIVNVIDANGEFGRRAAVLNYISVYSASAPSVAVVVADDDAGDVFVGSVDQFTVIENDWDSFQVFLTRRPAGTVTLTGTRLLVVQTQGYRS